MYPLGFHKSVLSVRDVTFGVLYLVLALVFNHLVSLPDLKLTVKLFKPCFELPISTLGTFSLFASLFRMLTPKAQKRRTFTFSALLSVY